MQTNLDGNAKESVPDWTMAENVLQVPIPSISSNTKTFLNRNRTRSSTQKLCVKCAPGRKTIIVQESLCEGILYITQGMLEPTQHHSS